MPHQLILIDAPDVHGIRVECASCHAALTVPLTETAVNIPEYCPGCNSRWLDTFKKQNVAARTEKVVRGLQAWQSLTIELPFTLRLEIDRPAQS